VRYVVKLGGHSLTDLSSSNDVLLSLAEDLITLGSQGHSVCVIHGGGPQIDQALRLAGLEIEYVDGLRITSSQSISIIQTALAGVNAAIVTTLNARGVLCLGLRGFDGGQALASSLGGPWQLVAKDLSVNPSLIETLWGAGYVPVLSPVVMDSEGQMLNCNADELAGAVASALGADALFLLSDVDQLRADVNDAKSGLDLVTFAELTTMVDEGNVSGGMIPKVKAALVAGSGGATRVVIANASTKHILMKAISNKALTTEVTA
jgi:acetylglutamate kinase